MYVRRSNLCPAKCTTQTQFWKKRFFSMSTERLLPTFERSHYMLYTNTFTTHMNSYLHSVDVSCAFFVIRFMCVPNLWDEWNGDTFHLLWFFSRVSRVSTRQPNQRRMRKKKPTTVIWRIICCNVVYCLLLYVPLFRRFVTTLPTHKFQLLFFYCTRLTPKCNGNTANKKEKRARKKS